jgi:hypothetical protein
MIGMQAASLHVHLYTETSFSMYALRREEAALSLAIYEGDRCVVQLLF